MIDFGLLDEVWEDQIINDIIEKKMNTQVFGLSGEEAMLAEKIVDELGGNMVNDNQREDRCGGHVRVLEVPDDEDVTGHDFDEQCKDEEHQAMEYERQTINHYQEVN